MLSSTYPKVVCAMDVTCFEDQSYFIFTSQTPLQGEKKGVEVLPELFDLSLSLPLCNSFEILGTLDEEEGENVVGDKSLEVETPEEERRARERNPEK